jgi:hypothetical protein
MSTEASVEIANDEYHRVWDQFDDAFAFTPSVRPEHWSGFREPAPSITWDIGHLLCDFYPWRDAQATPYNLALLKALTQFVAADESVFALDWQHNSYEFFPHRFRFADDPMNWQIPALPSGEYHIFVTKDYRLGSLGHPWEQTVCVFGEGFVDAYEQASPLQDAKIVRQRLGRAR